MGNLLFSDSETFVKERPEKITQQQEEELYLKLAKEIIENRWSTDDVDDIISDLKQLSKSDTGFEMAKDLELFSKKASYNIETPFIEWLDDFDYNFYQEIQNNVKQWVKAHNIKPKLELGTKLIVKEFISRSYELKVGNIIYVNGYYEPVAQYCISTEQNSTTNILVSYEKIEKFCEICN